LRTAKEQREIAGANENLESLREQRGQLEAEFNAELQTLESSTDPLLQKIETVAQRPKKSDVTVRLVALTWVPCWKTADGKQFTIYE
jgi:hypothetical protein